MKCKILLAYTYKCIYTEICIYKKIREENNMKEQDFMEQLLNPFVTDRLAEVYANDSEYQNLIKEEDLIYQKLSDELPDEQADELERYFEAVSSTSSRKETLTYVQGMKDLLTLLKSLSKK